MSVTPSTLPSFYEQLLSEVAKLHEADTHMKALAVVEITTQEGAGYKEISLLALHSSTDEKMLNKYFRLFAKYVPYMRNNALKFELGEDHLVSLTYVRTSELLVSVRRILQGKELERVVDAVTIGGTIPEMLLYDILHARVLFDREATFECLYGELNQYPRDFAFRLVELLTTEIKEKMATVVSKSGFIKNVALVDVQIAVLRLPYALHNQYFPGFTKLKEISKRWYASEQQELQSSMTGEMPAFTKTIIKLLKRGKTFQTV